jgi:hypothetical protein
LDYSKHRTYVRFKSDLTRYVAVNDSFTYGTYFYTGVSAGRTCSDWNAFYRSVVNLPFEDVRFSQITASFMYEDLNTRVNRSTVATCTDPNIINNLLGSMKAQARYEGNCNGLTWRAFPCDGQTVFCVNCKRVCVPTTVCPGTSMSINPCYSCSNRAAASAVLNVAYRTIKLYPVLQNPSKVITSPPS